MKPRVLLPLLISLLVIAAFVIGATIIESSNQLNPAAWIWAQRKLPMLWLVDAFAALTLFPVFSAATAHNRLAGKAKELMQMRDAHRDEIGKLQAGHHAQMDQMLRNAVQSEQNNARQAEHIAAMQQAIEELTAKVSAVETETTRRHQALEEEAAKRHQALEEEAMRIAAQAFSALMDRVEATSRQMEAVNLAVQYQRAEVKQLRQGLRDLQHDHESKEVARLTPAELAAIQGDALPGTPNFAERNESNPLESKAETKIEAKGAEDKAETGNGTNLLDMALVYERPANSSPLP